MNNYEIAVMYNIYINTTIALSMTTDQTIWSACVLYKPLNSKEHKNKVILMVGSIRYETCDGVIASHSIDIYAHGCEH